MLNLEVAKDVSVSKNSATRARAPKLWNMPGNGRHLGRRLYDGVSHTSKETLTDGKPQKLPGWVSTQDLAFGRSLAALPQTIGGDRRIGGVPQPDSGIASCVRAQSRPSHKELRLERHTRATKATMVQKAP